MSSDLLLVKEKKALIIGNGKSIEHFSHVKVEDYELIVLIHNETHASKLNGAPFVVFSCDFNESEQTYVNNGGKMFYGCWYAGSSDESSQEMFQFVDNPSVKNVNILPSSAIFSGIGAIDACLTSGISNIDTIGLDFDDEYLDSQPQRIPVQLKKFLIDMALKCLLKNHPNMKLSYIHDCCDNWKKMISEYDLKVTKNT